MKAPLEGKAARVERTRGATYFKALERFEKHELGDQLVLGEVDYDYWFGRRPTSAFMNGLDEARIHWEITEDT